VNGQEPDPPLVSASWLDDASWVPPGIDTSVAHPARRYDYWLGGKDNFAVDRASGDAVGAVFPAIRTFALENRRFLARAVTFLAGQAGISQFLDVGTGIPTANNTHEVAQRINPAARVVYVDNDPIVLVHARALLRSTHPDGITAYIDADLREPDTILADPALEDALDLSRPVALMLVAILHFLRDEDRPYEVVARLVDALPAGSYLVMSHATGDHIPPQTMADAIDAATTPQAGFRDRTRAEFARFFDGHELVAPGIVSIADWRAENEPPPRPSAADVSAYGAVAKIHSTRP
jgi:hypothetical protein